MLICSARYIWYDIRSRRWRCTKDSAEIINWSSFPDPNLKFGLWNAIHSLTYCAVILDELVSSFGMCSLHMRRSDVTAILG
jgi:hypothetical protein